MYYFPTLGFFRTLARVLINRLGSPAAQTPACGLTGNHSTELPKPQHNKTHPLTQHILKSVNKSQMDCHNALFSYLKIHRNIYSPPRGNLLNFGPLYSHGGHSQPAQRIRSRTFPQYAFQNSLDLELLFVKETFFLGGGTPWVCVAEFCV